MTISEAAKIVAVLKNTYPNAYTGKGDADMVTLVNMWAMVTEGYSYESISNALFAYLRTDETGFPPVPGKLIGTIHKYEKHEDTNLNAEEAWALVSKAAADSNYHSKEQFEALPPVVRKAIGSPHNLREMGAMEMDELKTIEKSHFIRTYNACLAEAKESEKIPDAIKNKILDEQNKREALTSDLSNVLPLGKQILKEVE